MPLHPIRGPEPALAVEPSAPNTVGFSLAFEGGAALLRLAEREVDPGIAIRAADFEIPNVRFPLDVTGGADWFQNRRLCLRAIEIAFELNPLLDRLRAALLQHGMHLQRLSTEGGVVVVEGTVGSGDNQPFIAHVAIGAVRSLCVRLQVFDAAVFGSVAMTPAVLAHTLIAALPVGEAIATIALARVVDLGDLLVQPLLVQAGWKKAALGDVEIEWIHVGDNRITLVACSAVRPGWLPGRPVQPASACFTRGVRAMARGDAVNALAQAIVDGATAAAVQQARSLIDRFPEDDGTAALAAEALLLDPQSSDEAIELLQAARSRCDIQVLANVGRALREPAARAAALAELGAAAERTGQLRLARRAAVEQGRALLAQQQPAPARGAFEHALSFDERDADALVGAFEACLGQGLALEALRFGERALRGGREDSALAVRIGQLHLAAGDVERARRAFRRALRPGPRTDALLGLAQVAEATADPARAAALYQEACTIARANNESGSLVQGLAALARFALDVLSDPATALAAVEELVDRGIDDGLSALTGARAAESLGDALRARALFERALRLLTGNAERAYAHYRLGLMLLRAGEEAGAEPHLSAAVEQGREAAVSSGVENPICAQAQHALVESRARRGDPEALAEMHQREVARAVGPEARAVALLRYARARDTLGDTRGALLALFDAIQAHPALVGATDAGQQFLERCDRQTLAELVPRAAALPSGHSRQNLLLLFAQRAQAGGAVDVAASAIQRALDDGDTLAAIEAWVDLARTQGDRAALVDALGRLAALDPDHHGTDALLERARLYAGPLARPHDAVLDFRLALARGAPESVALALGDAAIAADDTPAAVDALRPLLAAVDADLRSRAARRLFELARQHGDDDLLQVAAYALEAAGDAEATDALDQLFERRVEHATLIERYAQRSDPALRLRAAALALTHTSDVERALALLRNASDGGPGTVERVAQLVGALPESVPAARRELALTFAQSLPLAPEQQRALLGQRLALLEGPLADSARAAAVREELLDRGQRDPVLLAAQRDHFVEQGDFERAASLAAELSDRLAEDPTTAVGKTALTAHRIAAEMAVRAGLDLPATRLYERLIEVAASDETMAPDLTRICSALADAYERQGRFEDVARTLARAVLVCRDEAAATALFRRTALVEENRLARPDRAIQAWQRVLRANPDDDDAARALSKLYEFVGDLPSLVELHRQRAQRATSAAQRAAFLIAAGDAVAESNPFQAVALYHGAIDAAPESPAAIDRLTRLSRQRGSLVSLVRGYLHAARLRSDAAAAQLYEEAGAILAGLLAQPRLAVPALLRAVERDPQRASAVRSLIEVLRVGIAPQVAERVVSRLQRISALDAAARLDLDLAAADLLRERTGQAAAARARFQDVLVRDPDNRRALEALIDLTANDPEPGAHLRFVDRRTQIGDARSAPLLVAAARRIVERDPEGARLRLAKALGRGALDVRTLQQAVGVARVLRDWALVAQLDEQLLEQTALDRSEQIELWREMAQIGDDRLQNLPLAIRALTHLVERMPSDDTARTRLGELLVAVGELESGGEQLDFALAGLDRTRDPDLWRRAAEARANCAETTGDLARAIALYAAICDADPTARAPNFRLAQLRAQAGDHAAAAAHLDHTSDLLHEHGDRIYALLRAAEHYERARDPAGAARAYLRAAALEPSNEDAWTRALQRAADSGDSSLRLEIDQRLEQHALEIGDRSERLARLAERAAAAGDRGAVAQLIGRALERNLDLPALQRIQAAATGDDTVERSVLDRILGGTTSGQERAEALLRRAQISSDAEAAASDVRAAIDAGGRAPSHEDRYVQLLRESGRTKDAAAALLEFAEKTDSAERVAQLLRAWWSLDLDHGTGDGPAALARWVAVAPDAFEPRWELARQAAAVERWDDAVDLLQRLAAAPLTEGQRRQLDRALGEAAWRAGAIEVATAALARAVANDPNDRSLQRNYGEALVAAERFAEAAQLFEQLGRQAESIEQGEADLQRAAELWRDGVEDDARALELMLELQQRRPGDRAIRGATLELLRACSRLRELGAALTAAAEQTAGLERREFLRLAATVYDEEVGDPQAALVAFEQLWAEAASDELRSWRARLLRQTGNWSALAQQLTEDVASGDAALHRAQLVELAHLRDATAIDCALVARRLAEIVAAAPADREALGLLREVALSTPWQGVLAAALEQVAAQTEGQAAAQLLLETAELVAADGDATRALDLRLRAARRTLDDAALVDDVATRLVRARRDGEAAELLRVSSARRAGFARAWSRYCACAVAARQPGVGAELATALGQAIAARPDPALLAANAIAAIAIGDRERALDLVDRLAASGAARTLPAGQLEQLLLVAAQWSLPQAPDLFPCALADAVATDTALATADCACEAAGRHEELAARLQHAARGDRMAQLERAFALWAGPLDRPERALDVASSLAELVPAAQRPRWLIERAAQRYRLDQVPAARSDLLEAAASAPVDEWRYARARDLSAAAGDAKTLTALFDLRARREVAGQRTKYIFLAAETALLADDPVHAISRLLPLLAASATTAARAADRLWQLAWERRDRDLALRLAPRLGVASYLNAPQRLRCCLDAFGLTGDPAFLRLAHGLAQLTQDAARTRDIGRALLYRGQAPAGPATLDDVRTEALRLDAEGQRAPALARMATVAAADPEAGQRYVSLLTTRGRFVDRDRLLQLWRQRASGRSLATAELWRARIYLEQTADVAGCQALIEAARLADPALAIGAELEPVLAAARGDPAAQAHFLTRRLALVAAGAERDDSLQRLVTLYNGPLADPAAAQRHRLLLAAADPADLGRALEVVRGHLELRQDRPAAVAAGRALSLIGRAPDAAGRAHAESLLSQLRDRPTSAPTVAGLGRALVALDPQAPTTAAVLATLPATDQAAWLPLYTGSSTARAAAAARLAERFTELGDQLAAVAYFELAQVAAPSAKNRSALEQAYFRAGCFDRLAEAYGSEIALTADPIARSSLHFNLAELYRDRLQQPATAREQLERAARLTPREPVILRARIDLERLHGTPAQLASALENLAAVIGAGEALALRSEAGCVLEESDPERAAALLQSALSEAPRDSQLNAVLGRIAERRGNFADAIEHFMAAASTATGTETVRHWLHAGRLAENELRDLRLALHAYREAADSGDTLGLAAAERIARALGDVAALERVLGRRAVATQNPRVRADLLVERAGLLFASDRPREANLLLDGLFMEAPDDIATALAAGRLLESWRRPKQALATYERVLAVPARDSDPHILHEIELRAMQLSAVLGGLDRATRYAERVLEREPGSLPALTVLEAAAREQGDGARLVDLLRRRLALALAPTDRAHVLLDLSHTYADVLRDEHQALDCARQAYQVAVADEAVRLFYLTRLEQSGEHATRAEVWREVAAAATDTSARINAHLERARILSELLHDDASAIEAWLLAGSDEEVPGAAARALFAAYERTGRSTDAGAIARRLLDAHPVDADTVRWRVAVAAAAHDAGDDTTARSVLQQAIELAPAAAAPYFKLWELLRGSDQRGEFAPLAARGRQQLSDTGQRAALGVIEAELAQAAGDDDKAYDVLAAALDLSADDAQAVASFRELCLRRNRMARFAKVLQRHVDAAHDRATRAIRQRDLAFVLRDYLFDEQRAGQMLRSVLVERPDDIESREALADLCYRAQDFGEAKQLLDEMLPDADPAVAAERAFRLAQCDLALGDQAGYEQQLRAALHSDPQHQLALAALAQFLIDSGRVSAAIALATELRERGTALDPAVEARWLRMEAEASAADGALEAAADLFWRAHHAAPGDEEVLTALADVLRRQGRLSESAEALRRLAPLARDPARQVTRFCDAADIWQRAGDFGAALRAYSQAADVDPNESRTLAGIAHCAFALHDGARFGDAVTRLFAVESDYRDTASFHAAAAQAMHARSAPATDVLAQYEIASALAPDDRALHLAILPLAIETGRAAVVVDHQESLLATTEDPTEVLERAAHAGRVARDVLGDRRRAIGLLYRAHCADPSDRALKRELAALYAEEPAMRREAMTAQRQILGEDPALAEPYLTLARLLRDNSEETAGLIVAEAGALVSGGALQQPATALACVRRPLALGDVAPAHWPRHEHALVRALTPVAAALLEGSAPAEPARALSADARLLVARELEIVDALISGAPLQIVASSARSWSLRHPDAAIAVGPELLERGALAVRVALARAAAELRWSTHLAWQAPAVPLRELLTLVLHEIDPARAAAADDVTVAFYRERLPVALNAERRALAQQALSGVTLALDQADLDGWCEAARQLTARLVLCATGSPLCAVAVLIDRPLYQPLVRAGDDHGALLARPDVRELLRFAAGETLALIAMPEPR